MFELTVSTHFDAAHALVGYKGECQNLHGHTWTIDVTVYGTELDEIGILYDFKDLKADINDIIKPLDHAYLNEVAPFDTMNSTAENLSRWLYEKLRDRLLASNAPVKVKETAVWESPIAKTVYYEG